MDIKLMTDLVVTLHNEGSPEQWTEVVAGEPGGPTMGYFDTDHAEEYVRRINAHPDLVARIAKLEAAMENIREWSNSRDGSAEADETALTEINGIASAAVLS